MRIQCKGCEEQPSEHDSLSGYCLICADKRVRDYDALKKSHEKLVNALKNISETERIEKNELADFVKKDPEFYQEIIEHKSGAESIAEQALKEAGEIGENYGC